MKIKYLFLIVFFIAAILPYVAKGNASHYLTIQGKDIWVRDKPVTGKVVMKLNTGDKCVILGFDEPQVIGGKFNFWFKVSFNGRQGWVFGSQSDLAVPVSNESYEQSWANFYDWLIALGKTLENTSFDPSDLGAIVKIAEDGENTTFTFNHTAVLESKFGSFTCTREYNTGNGSAKANKTFLLGLKDSKWEFLTHFDGLTSLTIKPDSKRILFISDDLSFSAGVSYTDNGKGGVAGNYKETLKRNMVVTMVAVADLAVRNVQAVMLFNDAAPAKRAGMFGPIQWDETTKIISVTSSKQPVQLKWDPVKLKFVPV